MTPSALKCARLAPTLLIFCLTFVGVARVVAAQDGSGPYVLQRGDQITIKVYSHPELDDTMTIRPDGRISLVLLDDVNAADLTTDNLDTVLTERYSKYFRDPEVTVIVRTFANRRVYVGGEVVQPMAVELVGELTALSAVFRAGGFMKTARTDSVVLLRNDGNNRPLIQTLDLKKVLAQGDGDIRLRPFDVVFVPKSRIASVDQFVDQYMRQLVPITLTAGFTYILGGTAIAVR
jgi:protein involved in polysaccharide export with SLBB domain